jgi:hypothetical protein
LEGVVNELHAQQEEHEEEHAEIEAKLKPQAQSSANDLADLPIQPKFDEKLTTVLLIIASSQRPDYLQKTLHYVTTYHPKLAIYYRFNLSTAHPLLFSQGFHLCPSLRGRRISRGSQCCLQCI